MEIVMLSLCGDSRYSVNFVTYAWSFNRYASSQIRSAMLG
nr:MAG TPA: hypothetical protein [Caudoviricetes sp.]